MPGCWKVSPEQIIARLRQIEGQLAQGMSLALACKEAGISEQGRDRRLARPLQSGSVALILGLPAPRARDPRLCQPPTHVTDHAVVSLNPVQNPGQVRRKLDSVPDRARRRAPLKTPSGGNSGLIRSRA